MTNNSIDLCSSEHLPEVEIFSLLEEQIPKYKLRADTLTQFAGYQNEVSTIYIRKIELSFHLSLNLLKKIHFPKDWFVPSPALQIPEGGFGLNSDQIRETLNYFRK